MSLPADGRSASVAEANVTQSIVQAHVTVLRNTQLSSAAACGGVETMHLVNEVAQLCGGVSELGVCHCAGRGHLHPTPVSLELLLPSTDTGTQVTAASSLAVMSSGHLKG